MGYFMLIFQVILIGLTIFYLYCRHRFSYWSRRGVKGPTPLPFFGTQWSKFIKGQHVTELEWERKYGKVYGIYMEYKPALVITDPELIKQVTIKDFPQFVNRMKANFGNPVSDKLLFFMEGEDWKRVRAICSPAFTSGKLRGMKKLMNECIDKLTDYFEKMSATEDGLIDVKKVVSGFTIDVIASTSFGTETNANGDREKENPFVENGIKIFANQANFKRIFLFMLLPRKVLQFIRKMMPKDSSDGFFANVGREVVKQRRENNVRRNDFVQLLMESFVSENALKDSGYSQLTATDKHDDTVDSDKDKSVSSKSNKYLSDDEIIAQCVIFFIAGFETTATTISHCIFELAKHPSIQERLYDELHEALNGLDPNSEAYYEKVMTDIPYLEAVMKETLRKYPPVFQLERRCGVDKYKLGDVTLEKEQMVYCSVYSVHYNPDYYPEPQKFSPERFLPENKHLLVPYTYLPFGNGPRNCIGMRFAYQEIRMCLAKIIPKFQFIRTKETPEELQFKVLGLHSANSYSLKVVKRK